MCVCVRCAVCCCPAGAWLSSTCVRRARSRCVSCSGCIATSSCLYWAGCCQTTAAPTPICLPRWMPSRRATTWLSVFVRRASATSVSATWHSECVVCITERYEKIWLNWQDAGALVLASVFRREVCCRAYRRSLRQF